MITSCDRCINAFNDSDAALVRVPFVSVSQLHFMVIVTDISLSFLTFFHTSGAAISCASSKATMYMSLPRSSRQGSHWTISGLNLMCLVLFFSLVCVSSRLLRPALAFARNRCPRPFYHPRSLALSLLSPLCYSPPFLKKIILDDILSLQPATLPRLSSDPVSAGRSAVEHH